LASLPALALARRLQSAISAPLLHLAETAKLVSARKDYTVRAVRENEDELVEYKAKANFRVLGKQLGKEMKAAAEKIGALELRQIHELLAGREITLELDGRSFPLTPGAVEIQRLEKENLRVINDGSLTVALDPELTPELIEEGMIRDLVRGIQNLRKEKGLDVSDRISLTLSGSNVLRSAAENHRDHLLSETLAVSWKWDTATDAVEIDCGEEKCTVSLRKASS